MAVTEHSNAKSVLALTLMALALALAALVAPLHEHVVAGTPTASPGSDHPRAVLTMEFARPFHISRVWSPRDGNVRCLSEDGGTSLKCEITKVR